MSSEQSNYYGTNSCPYRFYNVLSGNHWASIGYLMGNMGPSDLVPRDATHRVDQITRSHITHLINYFVHTWYPEQ